MKKKVLRISTVPISLNDFLRGQLQMLNKHYEVVGVSSPGPALDEVKEREGVRVVELPMERHISIFKDLVSLFRMIHLFYKEKPDMVHSLTPKAGLISMLAGWVTRVPVRMHTFTGLIFPTATGLKQKILIWMDRLTCTCATHINPEGNGVKQDLIRYGITKKPLKILANGSVKGINLEFFQRTPEVLQAAAPYQKEDCFTFCFVGRMVRDKGINELVSAFVRLNVVYPKTRLLLVGPFEKNLDPVEPETEKHILHHPAIEFMDERNDVRPFLAASQSLVFPSYREGFPNVVIEAGALGLPAIATNINGCNEIILPGKNGVLIEPKDEAALYAAMEDFVLHQDVVAGYAKNCRQLIVERYDRKLIWDALLEEYNVLLKDK